MSGVVNVKRRTWDQATYSRLALDRQDKVGTATSLPEDVDTVETSFGTFKRAELTAAGPSGTDRAYLDISAARARLDLDSRVGKAQKVEGGAKKAGYECELCDLVFHDSDSLLDHLNSRLHLGKLGFSMKTQLSSADDVRSRLALHMEKAVVAASTSERATGDSLEARIQRAEAEAEARKLAKKEARKKKKAVVTSTQDEAEEDMESSSVNALLGFSSFGGGEDEKEGASRG